MTRATLLQVLARPTALGPAEVRELEQLAQAFPYCQTAHLLLAKAAHDQGTMLAGQRLRRAATYAADRTLLRRLIEEVEPAPVSEPIVAVNETSADAAPIPNPQLAAQPAHYEEVGTLKSIAEVEVDEAPAVQSRAAPVVEVQEFTAAATPAEAEEAVAIEPAAEAAPNDAEPVAEASPEQEPTAPEAATEPVPETPTAAEATLAPEEAPAAPQEVEAELLPVLVDQEDAFVPAVSPVPELAEAVQLAEEPDLPAQAPAIRPPVEVGEARFEFGLAEPPPPAYELPGLVDEWAAAAVTLSLGSPEPGAGFLALNPGAAAEEPEWTPAAFTGDETIGYGFGESSRLGFSLQLLNLLTDKAEAADNASVEATAQPAVTLPPPGAYFEPDPLLLDHWATHRPPPPALPSSLDLINNFLKRQPRLTRPAMLPPAPGGQADLSVRSTRAEPDLVSENLARIFVRQGKTARAIEIYEKLMVKQPEKMAYFAAQIQSLQPPA
ncbi:hypothetical protein [Hymenobacter ruricola]|uniref:Tetratricopeptide repeat protein n=1 Tax=Hymenobacter ruricola TaxID=2791023 RepID=A0ABS0I1N4_9BACT|nr:hypothetical protein [Hymenobacter ruricola]MBF9220686.1 hypothetical protein [Hymenobacter ruricola]